MASESPEVLAAQSFTNQASAALAQAPSFQQLDAATRSDIMRDLNTIRQALQQQPGPAAHQPKADPYALALETPADLARRRSQTRFGRQRDPGGLQNQQADQPAKQTPSPKTAATETLAARAGALSDEIDFPGFVASLIHGTFDAIVDSSIRQMEAFAELVSAVAKDVDRFTSENVTVNQARDWLAQQHPHDLRVEFPNGQPRLKRRLPADPDEAEESPAWLNDYDLAGEDLNDELIEQHLVPAARRRIGESRLQMLASMVLMGMNRVIVRDGTISAKVRFRARGRDQARVNYAVSQDPGGATWGSRGSGAYSQSSMMVSTVGVNVQAEAELKAELFGEVKINFASETLPLDQFVDAAQMALLQQNARTPPVSSDTTDTPPAINLPPPPPPPLNEEGS